MVTTIEIQQCKLGHLLRVYTQPCKTIRSRISQDERDGKPRPQQIEGIAMVHEGPFGGLYTPKGTDLKFFTIKVISDKPIYFEKDGVIQKIIGYERGERLMYIPMKTITKVELIKINEA